MKKNIIIFFSIFMALSCVLFSCKENSITQVDNVVESREVEFADVTSEIKDELIFYSMAEDYKLSEESIENDLSSFLALKMLDAENVSEQTVRSINSAVDKYDIQKVKTFKKVLPTNVVLNKNGLESRSADVTDEINFAIYDISNQVDGTKGVAVTSDDERIGSLLCVLDNIDYTDDVEDPVLQIFLTQLENYVEDVSYELESITEDDIEYFKEKYGITDEEIAQAKLEYENTVVSRKFWGYDSWSSWSVNDINLNNLSAKTKWSQGSPYNSAIVAMEGKNYVTGCGATAVAQIMAYHSWLSSYTRNDLSTLKSKWSLASSWNGVYDWKSMTSNPNADYLSAIGKVCVGALMYDVSKGINSTYKGKETSSIPSNIPVYLKKIGYTCNNFQAYSFDAIKTSLNKDCPVVVAGYNSTSGHAWVIDGSLELIRTRNYYVCWIPFKSKEYQNYVHCNYGWAGYCDNGTAYTYKGEGYYKSGVFETSVGDYSDNLVICTNIKPNR